MFKDCLYNSTAIFTGFPGPLSVFQDFPGSDHPAAVARVLNICICLE